MDDQNAILFNTIIVIIYLQDMTSEGLFCVFFLRKVVVAWQHAPSEEAVLFIIQYEPCISSSLVRNNLVKVPRCSWFIRAISLSLSSKRDRETNLLLISSGYDVILCMPAGAVTTINPCLFWKIDF